MRQNAFIGAKVEVLFKQRPISSGFSQILSLLDCIIRTKLVKYVLLCCYYPRPKSMKKRQWAILGGVLLLAVAFWLMKSLSKVDEQANRPVKKVIKAIEAKQIQAGSVPVRIPIDGPLVAKNKIEIYSEVNGIIESSPIPFETGNFFDEGDLLLSLNDSEARSAYLSAKSLLINTLSQLLPDLKLDYPDRYPVYYDYLKSLNRQKELSAPPRERNDQLKLFLSGRGLYSNYQNAESAQIRLKKYQIRAPYPGTLTEALVEVGQLVRPGQKLGEFIGKGSFEMIASVASSEIERIKIGDSVRLVANDNGQNYQGRLFRKNEKLDPSTQRVQIFIEVAGTGLSDGEYLKGQIGGQKISEAMAIDRKLMIDENHLFRVEDSVLVKQEVTVIHSSPEEVIIAAPMPKMLIPKKPVAGAFEGMKVRIIKTKE